MEQYIERNETYAKHLFDGMKFNVYETEYINLSAGTPNEKLLEKCNQLFAAATKHLLEYEAANHSFIFQYGPACGTYRFRSQLAEFLTKKYQSYVDAADLVLTAGASYGLLIILSALIDLNGVVFVDEATYMIALQSISSFHTLKIVPVKLKEDGVDLQDLEQKVIQHKFKSTSKMFFGCYYTMPTFHNPTGLLFSQETCEALIKIARKHDLLIVCDDVYNLLHYDDPNSPKRLYAYDNFNDDDFKGHIISNGTFSKILAPGTRVGWMECSPRIAKVFSNNGFLNSGGAISNYTSGIISSMLEMGIFETHVNECFANYKSQRDAMLKALYENLPVSCTFQKPKGGQFIWIRLPENIDAESLCSFVIQKYKVKILQGNYFSLEGKLRNYVRISFAFHPDNVLYTAGIALCKGIEEYIQMH